MSNWRDWFYPVISNDEPLIVQAGHIRWLVFFVAILSLLSGLIIGTSI